MDIAIVEWVNGGVGVFEPWDAFMQAVMSDYLVPAFSSLMLIGLWFTGRGAERYANQLAVMVGVSGLGLANLGIAILNGYYFRDRPFVHHDLNLLFYEPTDSSFPANAAAVGFAIAIAVAFRKPKLGLALAGLSLLWTGGRVYAGVHYPTDILAGAAMGAAGVGLAYLVARVIPILPSTVLRIARGLYLA